MPYIRIPQHLDDDLRELAENGDLATDQILERRFYGYEVKEEIAREAKEALEKYTASEKERYDKIKRWIESKTAKMGQKLIVEYDKIFLNGEDL